MGKKIFFNLKNLFFVSFLAVAGIFSATAIIKNKQVEEAHVVEKAEAADSYSLAGTMNGWNASDTTYDMTDPDKDGIYTTNYSLPASSNQAFKVVLNHAWTTSYGFSNLFIQHESGTVWDDGGNVNLWNKDSISLKIGFKPSTLQIMISASSSFPTGSDTFYLFRPDSWSDWEFPRIHYFNSGFKTVWDHIPTMTEVKSYTDGSDSGKLYSITIPSNTTGLLITKSDQSAQTANYSYTKRENGGARLYYDSGNKLQDFTYVLDGAYLRGSWTDGWSVAGQKAMTGSEGGPYSISNVSLSANDSAKAVYIKSGVESWCNIGTGTVTTNDDYLFPVEKNSSGAGDYDAKVTYEGTYNFTVTKSGSNWNYSITGITNVPYSAALTFVSDFATAMNANCPYITPGKTASDVAAAWSGRITAYSGLSEDAKYFLTDFNTPKTEISSFHTSYSYIYGHYSTVRALPNADFLEMNPPSLGSINSFSPFKLMTEDGADISTVIIIIASSVSLLSITALSVLLVKKRKSKEE